MTSDELKQLLVNVSQSLQSLQTVLAPNVDDDLIALLQKLALDSSALGVLLVIVKVVIPAMTANQLLVDVQATEKLLQTVKQMISSGEIAKIQQLCNSIESRPLLLAILARLL